MIVVNLSSTAVGSNATYQCRDGPTDVYTTQCTSTGVWDPHPLSTLDCSKETSNNNSFYIIIGFPNVMAIEVVLCPC